MAPGRLRALIVTSPPYWTLKQYAASNTSQLGGRSGLRSIPPRAWPGLARVLPRPAAGLARVLHGASLVRITREYDKRF
jgi:hypothetical protein